MRALIISLVLGVFLVALMAGPLFASDMKTGEAVYNKSCGACHNSGVMGAPKIGDKAAWAQHIEDGTHHMVENAIKGVGKMPPKGGNMKLTDEEVEAAVEYMVEKSQ